MLSKHILHYKNIFVSSITDGAANSITYEDYSIILMSTGIPEEHIPKLSQFLGVTENSRIDFLDFLTYIPLFVQFHMAVITNPLNGGTSADKEAFFTDIEAIFLKANDVSASNTSFESTASSRVVGPIGIGGMPLVGAAQRRRSLNNQTFSSRSSFSSGSRMSVGSINFNDKTGSVNFDMFHSSKTSLKMENQSRRGSRDIVPSFSDGHHYGGHELPGVGPAENYIAEEDEIPIETF